MFKTFKNDEANGFEKEQGWLRPVWRTTNDSLVFV
jgi:hypothetical protein